MSIATPVFRWNHRLAPTSREWSLSSPDHWTWCGSVIRGADGRYHMFASRWPKAYSFGHGWLVKSRVVRAVSATLQGPYHYEQDILPPRGASFWDGCMTHNPTIHHFGGRYYLYYTGVHYDFTVAAGRDLTHEQYFAALSTKRIGVAWADRVEGPWHRADAPLLKPRKNGWDHFFVSNPAVCHRAGGDYLMVYKGLGQPERNEPRKTLHLAAALAPSPSGPFRRVGDLPLFPELFKKERGMEDPCVWWNGHGYEMLAKDMTGEIGGSLHGTLHAGSADGVTWHLGDPPHAFSRTVTWTDDHATVQGQLERVQVYLEDGRPRALFVACGDGPGGFGNMTHSWNQYIPLNLPNPSFAT